MDDFSQRTTYGYDPLGRQVSQLDACGNLSTLVYNCRGDLTQQIDPAGRRTTSIYDPLGRVSAQIDATGAPTTSIYDAAGRLLARQNPRGYRTSYAYDSRSRQVGMLDPTGVWTTQVFDSRSNRIATVDGLGYRTTSIFDNLNRPTARQDALGYRTSTVYDVRSLPIATVDPLGHIRTTIYDVLQRPQALWLPDGTLTTTVYDPVGNPIATVSPLGFITTQVFDSRNRLIARQDPLGRFHSLVYDNAGRVWMQQDGKGQITTHLYVNCGDESVRTYADGTRVSFSYNSLRQLVGVADTTGLRTFSYDPVGRLQSFLGPEHPSGQPITYGYDSNSNCTLLQSWQGRQTYIYDPRDLLVEVQDAGFYSQGVAGGTTSISYDVRRQWITQTNPNGTRGTVLYDALGRATQIRHSTPANAEIAHAVSTYDPAGRLTLLQTQAGAFSYGYDVLNQLSSEVSPYTSLLSYGYDANHRRRFVQSGATLSTYNYDAADELITVQTGSSTLTYSYDANGSTLVFPSGSALTTFSWDAVNRLQSVHLPGGGLYTHLYRFDDLRRGMASLGGVIDTFVYAVVDPATQKEGLVGLGASPSAASSGGVGAWSSEAAPLLWWQRSGGASEWLVQSGMGAGLLRAVGQESSGGALSREYHLDNRGHVGATSTGSGSLETAFSYGAWGNVAAGSAVDNSLDYGGGWGYWHDATLGLSYVRARWLNPSTGSWLSVDPVSSEPRYSYAHNMPTTQVDPSGRQSEQARKLYQEYQRLRTRRQRVLELLALRRETIIERAYQQQSRFDFISGNPFSDFPRGFGNWLITGSVFPTEEEYTEAASVVWSGISSGQKQVNGAINQGSLWAEQEARSLLQQGKPVFSVLFPVSNVATANYRRVLAATPVQARIFLVPFPGTAAYIEYRAGFTFGVADSLFSLLLTPLQQAYQILDLIYGLTDVSDLWTQLQSHIRSFFPNLLHLLEEAGGQDPFTRGKVAGRLLVDLVLTALQGKAFIKGLTKGLGRVASQTAGGAAEKVISGALGSSADVGLTSDAEAAAKGLKDAGLTPENTEALTKEAIRKDIKDSRLPLPGAGRKRGVMAILNVTRDALGRTESITTYLDKTNLKGGTDPSDKLRAWVKKVGITGDKAGHLVADSVGGSGSDPSNIIPIDVDVNYKMRQVESLVKALMKNNKVKYVIEFEHLNTDNPFRPSVIKCKAWVEGQQVIDVSYTQPIE